MDVTFPVKSKKTIKTVNQAVSNNHAMMRLKIQNALYQQELKRVNAANDSVNAALALAQRQAHEAAAAAALAQRQAHEAAAAAANTNKQELNANIQNKKSSKFGKLLSKMNKHH